METSTFPKGFYLFCLLGKFNLNLVYHNYLNLKKMFSFSIEVSMMTIYSDRDSGRHPSSEKGRMCGGY